MTHHKAPVTWLLESLLLVSGSCSVLASHSELCVPLTRWMLADGNTVLLFNYLKCCMQIYLWHSTIEKGVCCPYPVFDRLFHISLFISLWRWFWFGYLHTYPVLQSVSHSAGRPHLLLWTGATWETVPGYKPKGQCIIFPYTVTEFWRLEKTSEII